MTHYIFCVSCRGGEQHGYIDVTMGAFLDKPKTEKYNESRVGGGLRYGLSSMQVTVYMDVSIPKVKFKILFI